MSKILKGAEMTIYKRQSALPAFAISRIVLGILPFIQIPFLVKTLGLNSWSRIAIVQSFAIFLGPLLDLGWSTRYWKESRFPNKAKFIVSSLRQKMLVLFFLSLVVLAYFAMLEHGNSSNKGFFITFVAFVSTLSGYLNNAWYWTAKADLRRLIYVEVIPKTILNLAAILLLFMSKNIELFFILLILSNYYSTLYIFIWHRKEIRNPYRGSMMKGILFGLGSTFRIGYLTSTLWIISYLGYSQMAIVATVERLYRLVSALMEPLSSNFIFKHSKANSKNLVKISLFKQCSIVLILFPMAVNPVVSKIFFGTSINYGNLFFLFYAMSIAVVAARLLVNAYSIYHQNIKVLSRFQYDAVMIFLASLIALEKIDVSNRVLIASLLAESIFCLRISKSLFGR